MQIVNTFSKAVRTCKIDMLVLVCVVLVLFTGVLGAESGSKCNTPNGENATCIPIHSCRVISLAISFLDEDAVEFAKNSKCGFDDGTPLVCCGSKGHLTTTPPPYSTPSHNNHHTEQPIRLPTSPEPIENVNLPDNTLCGIQITQLEDLNRIVGGVVTSLNEFPWMAALKYETEDGYEGGFRCGGTLITTRYVLTAAQCLSIKGFNLIGVRLGEWKISTSKDCMQDAFGKVCSGDVEDVKIIHKLPHPYYSKRSGNNDIALLKLERKIKYTEYIRPICLPPSDLLPPPRGTIMIVAGWGVTENGTESDIKLKVAVPMVSNEECERVHTNYTHVNPNQSCAGGAGGKDACRGDSGGPLMTTFGKKSEEEEQQWYQEGIVYRGLGCGRKDAPSLYTRVSRYTYWILNNLK